MPHGVKVKAFELTIHDLKISTIKKINNLKTFKTIIM